MLIIIVPDATNSNASECSSQGADVEAGQSADAAADEVNQRDPVPAAVLAGSETEGCRDNTQKLQRRRRLQWQE